jgi:hypothetical protein
MWSLNFTFFGYSSVLGTVLKNASQYIAIIVQVADDRWGGLGIVTFF